MAIVTSAFAAELLDGGNALGRRFSTGPTEKPHRDCGCGGNREIYQFKRAGPSAFWTPLDMTYKLESVS